MKEDSVETCQTQVECKDVQGGNNHRKEQQDIMLLSD